MNFKRRFTTFAVNCTWRFSKIVLVTAGDNEIYPAHLGIEVFIRFLIAPAFKDFILRTAPCEVLVARFWLSAVDVWKMLLFALRFSLDVDATNLIRILRNVSEDSRWQTVARTSNGPLTDYAVSYQNLQPSTHYHFRVIAFNKYGVSDPVQANDAVRHFSRFLMKCSTKWNSHENSLISFRAF